MLNVKKLNEEKQRVNQHLTKHGLKKPNIPAVIEAIALTLEPKAYSDESATIDKQLEKMKREKKEKKLLEYQLKTYPQNVSSFLVNKYSDGNFNVGSIDRYDNSDERKKHGITFDYHVYFKPEKQHDAKRGHNKYVMSVPIVDRIVGDTYTYHIPVWLNTDGQAPFYVTDYGENVDDPNARGLLWALKELRGAIESKSLQISSQADSVLTQWGFLKNGKIIHDPKRGFMVEKYLKSIANTDKQVDAIKYLDTMIKQDQEDAESWGDDVVVTDNTDDDIVTPGNPDAVVSENLIVSDNAGDDGSITLPHGVTKTVAPSTMSIEGSNKNVNTDSIDDDVDDNEWPGLKVTPGEYKDQSLEQIAKANNIKITVYTQLPTRDSKKVQSTIEVPLPEGLYIIRLRTGTQKVNINNALNDIFRYRNSLKSQLSKGYIANASPTPRVEELLKSKGFGALLEGNSPGTIVHGFEVAREI